MTTTSYNIKLLSLNQFLFFLCVKEFAVLPLKKRGGGVPYFIQSYTLL